MKSLKLIAAAAVAAASVAATPSFADAGKGPAKTTAEYCKFITDLGVTASVGECMGILRADDAPGLCKLIDFYGLLGAFGWSNRGQCVSALRAAGV